MDISLNVKTFIAFSVLAICVSASGADLKLALQKRILDKDSPGKDTWKTIAIEAFWPAGETGIVVCDMWDKHWSRGATERVAAMAPRMNETLEAARAQGVTIIHAPSETMDFYKDTPARKRVQDAPFVQMPKKKVLRAGKLPIDDSDGGSDTGETPWYKAWTRQHAVIEIDQERDGIGDDGQEIWNFMQQRGIKRLIIMGVHTNMCILNRPFAIKAMVSRDVPVVLVRDLTDTMYNPAMPPKVSHDEGTRLVVEYIEQYFCPTISSEQLIQQGQ